MKIMVVEDEKDIRDILVTLLLDEGFEVVALDSAVRLLDELAAHRPELLLLDQIMPGKTGVEALAELRANDRWVRIPVIMVTGLSGEDDKVSALDLGADDYVTKPFYPKELAARVKALARRATADSKREKIVVDRLTVDFSAHRVLLDDKEVPLTLTEFKILSELLRQGGQVLTREQLRERALGNLNVTDRTIDVHMASLRKKLETVGPQIETVRGVGYRFAASVAP